MNSLFAFTLLSLVLYLNNAHCQLTEGNCKHFADLLPLRLRDLRITFNKIKDYFQTRDDELDIMLLNENLLEEFKGYLGCQSVAEIIQFYLEDVLPNVTTGDTIERNVGFIQTMLQDLKQSIKRCHRFFICEKKKKAINYIRETYEKLQDKGIYKAMGEFDIFVNYIEEYLTMKMKK
ncbi:interleukin-10 [Tiliqua scincoides]|uniref:interleukin-10 n=1 Tax=Tiliqua scincoides TaxID=71010 RepID=UPI0034622C04